MAGKLHTPYDGSSTPFTIALRSLAPEEWIEVDEYLPIHLAEKETLFGEQHALVFQAEDDTRTAQQEVLDKLLDYLPGRYGDLYEVGSQTVTIIPANRTYDIADYAAQPLELAARLVQDDLVLMRPGEDGHRLVAAALCFPSAWSLADKFGKPLADVHGPVPGFGRGTRNADLIERIFSNLKPAQPVERFNWSIFDDPRLHYPASKHAGRGMVDAGGSIAAWLRIERQTLSKLPACGDILFTIKICVDPLDMLRRHPDGAALAASLREQICGLDPHQLAYKVLTDVRGALCSELTLIEQCATVAKA